MASEPKVWRRSWKRSARRSARLSAATRQRRSADEAMQPPSEPRKTRSAGCVWHSRAAASSGHGRPVRPSVRCAHVRAWGARARPGCRSSPMACDPYAPGLRRRGVEIADRLDCPRGPLEVPFRSTDHRWQAEHPSGSSWTASRSGSGPRGRPRASARCRYRGGPRGDASRTPGSAQDPTEGPTRRCRTSRPSAARRSLPCAAPSSDPPAPPRSSRSPRTSRRRRHRRAAARAGRGPSRRTGR
jgi:hypothetical protein